MIEKKSTESHNDVLLYRAPLPGAFVHPVHIYPSLSLKYIQALSQEEKIGATLSDGWISSSGLLDAAEMGRYKAIVIEIVFDVGDQILELLRRVKVVNPQVVIIIIGTVGTWQKEKYLFPGSPVDIVIPGEGELEAFKVLKALLLEHVSLAHIKNGISKLTAQKEILNISDPDVLPKLLYSKQEALQYLFIYPLPVARRIIPAYIKTSWGCSHRCIFCSQAIRKSYGNEIRMRSADAIVDEIEELIKKGINFISFEDDNFSSCRRHVEAVCSTLIKRNVRIVWSAQARVDEVDEEILTLMYKAGCRLLQFGIETGSEKVLTILHKSTNPNMYLRQAKKIFLLTRKIGISTCALLMIGNPEETESDVHESITYVKSIEPDLIKLHFFTPYAGSSFYEALSEQTKKNILFSHHHSYPTLNFSRIPSERLYRLRSLFYRQFYCRIGYIINHVKYIPYYMCNLQILTYLFRKSFSLFNV